MNIASFISANCHLLEQLSGALSRLSVDSYSLHRKKIFDSSVGGHTRHIIDHYENFLASLFGQYPVAANETPVLLERPMINYDRRLRERQIEVDPAVAIARIAQIMDILARVPRDNVEVDIILQIDFAPEAALQASTLARELSFLHSHSVHHLAIISYIFKAIGIDDLPQDFGIAPSTITFRQAM